jgi:hypothetical protein
MVTSKIIGCPNGLAQEQEEMMMIESRRLKYAVQAVPIIVCLAVTCSPHAEMSLMRG